MNELASLYRMTEANLALRREFMGITSADLAALRRLERWSDRVADRMAREFYDHQFSFAPTATCFEAYAQVAGRSISQLREGLERSQAGYFRECWDPALVY